jgi:YD repeat-containing protein
MNASITDRDKLGLRGPVTSVVDEWSTTEFDHDGKILVWSGNTSHGRVERNVYDESGRLIRISGSNGDHTDEVRYDEQGRKTRIRHVPARPEQQSRAFGIAAWFDCTSEGDTLTDGGTVETMYNEHDQPGEARILDDEGTVLFQIAYTYDADGRLSRKS